MELDELKAIWQQLDQRLAYENSMSLALLRHQKLDGARKSLRPLALGQKMQIFWGILFVLLAGLLWSAKPHAVAVIVAGVIVQAYGIGCLIAAGMVLGAMERIDYAGSVLEVQGRLARVGQAYAISSIVGGFSWWFLWIPLLMVLFGLAHVNLYAHTPSVIWIGVAVGVAGLLGMGWVYRASRRDTNSRLRRLVDETLFSKSFERARAQVEEIRRFEREAAC